MDNLPPILCLFNLALIGLIGFLIGLSLVYFLGEMAILCAIIIMMVIFIFILLDEPPKSG